MKKSPFFVALGALLVVAFAFVASKNFVGHWRVHYGNGDKGNVVFRNDGTAEATFDGTTWKVGGPYKQEGTTLSMADSTCGFGYWATYKATWYSDDSVLTTIIEDTCMGRKNSVDGAVLVRVK
ncbi:MAG TPA: hypothetical protein VGS79_24395 [Puia sp.]|nr:hypothetical protein [Puia sp.]